MAGFDIDGFIDEVRRARSAGSDAQAAVAEVLARAIAEPRALMAALGEPTEAGFFTLHHAPDLTILNFVWAPLMVLLPHNHTMWASIGIYTGREDNLLWERENGRIHAVRGASISAREVFNLDEDAVHSVVNPIEKLTAAIHVYGGDFFAPGRSEWDPETLAERPFDVERTRQRFREANARFRATQGVVEHGAHPA